ncbi:unnamed protein product [Effrenium voratum]|uniref:Uncharacterized protein n=1 Tax=Effrenium voratum TaxID=2562239 RepID=A0AA36N6T3_9DINO|nr:unnamed protein product [Effrenium voratum]
MELHMRIPAERWCITKTEFFTFVKDVLDVWSYGQLPDCPQRPNPSHNDRKRGPNLYQVNEHFVKPVTLAAGGMSYALMLHPEGLPCHVFVSHAWAEGLFELGNNVRRAWPQVRGLLNMYLCLLGNPQNLDMERLLVSPEHSPFAKALSHASHVLVIPNGHCSIYTRLWCVYEAYLGTVMHKTCLMPLRPRSSAKRVSLLCTILLPCLFGLLLGIMWTMLPLSERVEKKSLDFAFNLLILSTTLAVFISIAGRALVRPRLQFQLARPVHMLNICLASAMTIPWFWENLELPNVWQHLTHGAVPFALILMNVTRVSKITQQQLANNELSRQASHLSFQSLSEASCSSDTDETRIREAIAGFEDEVIVTLQVLMKAGIYTKKLRQAHTLGLDISGMVSANLRVNLRIVAFSWLLSILDTMGCMSWIQCCSTPPAWSYYASLGVVGFIMFLLPLLLVNLDKRGPEWPVFAVNCWVLLSSIGLVAPIGVTFVVNMHEVGLRQMPARFAAASPAGMKTTCPFTVTWMLVLLGRPFMAILSAAVTFVEPTSFYLAKQALGCSRRHESRTPKLKDLEGLEDSSGTGSDSDSPVFRMAPVLGEAGPVAWAVAKDMPLTSDACRGLCGILLEPTLAEEEVLHTLAKELSENLGFSKQKDFELERLPLVALTDPSDPFGLKLMLFWAVFFYCLTLVALVFFVLDLLSESDYEPVETSPDTDTEYIIKISPAKV